MDGFAAVRRWWWVLLLGAVVAGLVAWGLVSTVERSYTAETRLLVGPISGDKDTLEAAGQLARTYAELATSVPVAAHVVRTTTRGGTAEELIEDMATSSNDVNRIVSVRVTDTEAERSAQLANAIAARLERISRESSTPDQALIDALGRQPEIQGLPRATRARVQEAAVRVLTSSPAGRLQVVEPASTPTDPSAPREQLIIALAALAGLIATGLVVFLRATAPDATGDQQLAEIRDAPFLGGVEAGGRGRGQGYGYRLLAGRAGLLTSPPSVSSLLVLDVGDGRAAAAVALNLASALEYDGRGVLLVDAALDGSVLEEDEAPAERLGYGDLLSGEAPDRQRIRSLTVERADGLRVLPLGEPAKRFIDMGHARELLAAASSGGDIVIVSGASIDQSAATLSWSRAVDTNLLVVDARAGSRERLAELAQTLLGLGANILGTVVARSAGGRWRRGARTAA